jgi:hypothetical protein
MTYDLLKADITNYCERDDEPFVTQIPRFIMMAENRLASELKTLGFLRTVQGTMTTNVVVKPARWRATRSICLINGVSRQYLLERSYEFCRRFAPDTSVTSLPRYYADYDYEHLFVAATPDVPYMFEMQYYERPEPLSDVNQTNWITQYAPQLLLYATLMEAMPFLKSSERLPEFQTLYDRATQMLTKEDAERIIDAAATRKV